MIYKLTDWQIIEKTSLPDDEPANDEFYDKYDEFNFEDNLTGEIL